MLFDSERYLQEIESAKRIKPLKAPNNKVPAVNLPKLAFDKKIAPIVLDIRFGDKFILRDRFDWDLMEPRLRPIDFSTALCNQLPFFKTPEEKQKAIQNMTNSILDQIQAHIDKNTFFPRVRFCRKEEEMISNDQVCVNCDSILNNPDFCIHCGFQYERKPGANAQGASTGGQLKEANSMVISNVEKKNIVQSSGYIQQSSILNYQQSTVTQAMPSAEEQAVFQVPVSERSKQVPEQQEKESLKQRITTGYTYSGKEKKVCKKCGEINPFFKNECKICNYKFPKTRGLYSSLNSDNYTLYFWDMLHSDPLFSSLNRVNDYLEESDFISVRDLYKKIKEVLSQPNTERMFDITDTQLLELHDSIDEKFEWLLTDNDLTDRIFNDATSIKSSRKRNRQVFYNFKDAQEIFNRKLENKEYDDNNNNEDTEPKFTKKRKVACEAQIKQKNRPHNFESIQMQTIVSNYNLLSQMGFLEPKVIQNEAINKLMNEKDSAISMIKKRGRPKKFDLTYEDMQHVEQWDDSKLIFQNNLIGQGQNQDEEANDQNGGAQQTNLKKGYADGNADVCGICYNDGKLICCDDCPAAFHAECLGYEKQCPRGKWKCYFCKVTKYGLKQVPRMAPNETPVCDKLTENTSTWEEKALTLLDILKDYQCIRTFYEKVELTPEQLENIKKKKLEEVQNEIPSIQDLYDKIISNSEISEFDSHQQFYDQLKQILNVFTRGLDKKDIIHLQAKASLLLIEKLIDENEIFNYIKPLKKKSQRWARQSSNRNSTLRNAFEESKNDIQISLDDEQEEAKYQQELGKSQSSQKQEDSDFEVNIEMSSDNNFATIKTRTQIRAQAQEEESIQSKPVNTGKRSAQRYQQIGGATTPGRVTRNRTRSQQNNDS